MELVVGIEPPRRFTKAEHSQSAATSTEPQVRVELTSLVYETSILPLYYRGAERVARVELAKISLEG